MPTSICVINISPVAEAYLPQMKGVVEACCRRVLHPDTQLEFRAPSRGPAVVPARLEDFRNPYFAHLVAAEVIETIVRADREGFDALVVNCFDDPGVREARSFATTPVLGLSEPTFHLACQLGAKFGALVPDMPGQVAFVQKQIDDMGLSRRCIVNGVRAERKRFTESFAEALQNPEPMVGRLTDQGRELIDDGADVIVIACGGLGQICGVAGFHTLEHKGAMVPVINPLTTAAKTAEMLVAMHRGIGTPIPSQAHAGRRLSAEELARVRTGFSLRD
ncbi:MAG: aspartate/glutamate racemase family protein [Candidatus Binatia bacterium]